MFGRGIWPVVRRELQAGARHPFNHWLRVAGLCAALVVLFGANFQEVPISEAGSQIFEGLNIVLLASIFCVVPAITADCIARERREGTLGLLFLTPLHAWEIVLGKVLVQVLRALTLWLAVLPALTIPFLTGGVGWPEVANSLSIELCAGMLCLAAGMVASSLTEKRAAAFVLAFALAAALDAGLNQGQSLNALHLRGTVNPPSYVMLRQMPNISMQMSRNPYTGFYGPTGWVTAWAPPKVVAISFGPLAEKFLIALLVLWVAMRFAGYCVERSWQDRIPSERRKNWVRRYCTPIFQRWFARQMRRTLEWNPVAWLQQYSWKARLTKWGLCLGFVVLECMATASGNFREIAQQQSILLAILAVAYTYAGVNGFLQEKKSGALELILVTPLTVNQILFGRVWGLWKQFLPAALLLAGCWAYCRYFVSILNNYNWGPNNTEISPLDFAFFLGFFALPVYATWFALRFKNIILAAAGAWVALVGAPVCGVVTFVLAALLLGMGPGPVLLGMGPGQSWIYLGILAGNIVFVLIAVRSLRRSLARRVYSF